MSEAFQAPEELTGLEEANPRLSNWLHGTRSARERAFRALALSNSGKTRSEIGKSLGVGCGQVSLLIAQARFMNKSQAWFADHLQNGINDYTLIAALEISARLGHCFTVSSIRYVGEARRLSKAELLRLPGFGGKCLDEWNRVVANIPDSRLPYMDYWGT